MQGNTMTTYTYLFHCRRWWGSSKGVRNLVLSPNTTTTTLANVAEAAVQDAKQVSGSTECSIDLLQKFKLTVALQESYPALIQFPLTHKKE